MVENTIQSEREELGEGKLALTEFARAASIGYANLLEAERGDGATKVRVRITVRADKVDDTAADQAKVSSVHWELVFAEEINEPIEKATGKSNYATFGSLDANPVDDIGTGLPVV